VLELIDPAGTQPGGGDSFALEGGEATLVYVFDYRKRRSFVRFMLGFSYADAGDPFRLRRENPKSHPSFPWLHATTVHFSGIGIGTDEESDPVDTPNFPAVFTGEDLKKTTRFDKVYATVRFVHMPWTFRPDAFVTSHRNELERNCYFDPVPQVDLLQAEGGTAQLKWAQGGGAGPVVDDVIANSFAMQVGKTMYTLNWMWVPESYLSDDPMLFFPKNLLSVVTKVGSRRFANRPAGTMLALAPQLQRFRFPVETFDGLFPFYGWNVKIPLVYFNPDRGVPRDTVAYPTQAQEDAVDTIPRGHRLLPWRQNALWYEAVREDGATHLFLEDDLFNLFKHVGAP
jgi:hypothetical protein